MLKIDELVEKHYYSILDGYGDDIIFELSIVRYGLIYRTLDFLIVNNKFCDNGYRYLFFNDTIKEVLLIDFVSYLSSSHPYKIKFRKRKNKNITQLSESVKNNT